MVLYGVFYLNQNKSDQGTDGVEDAEDHNSYVSENSQPHIGNTQRPEEEAGQLDADGKPDIFIDDPDALAGKADRAGNLHRVIVHENHVRRLDCCI